MSDRIALLAECGRSDPSAGLEPKMRSAMVAANSSTGGEVGVDQDTGLERKRKDSREIDRSLNPEKVRIHTINMTIDQIVSRVDHGEIDLTSDFRRSSSTWDDNCRCHLIESILLRIPISALYFTADVNNTWSVVDGFHRISTIHDYMTGRFPLSQLEYFRKLNGCSYERLPRQMQRRFEETPILANIIEPGTPEEVILNIYRRINAGAMGV